MGWKVLKLWAFLAASIALMAPKALATEDLACTIDDANLAFAMFASTNRDHGTIVGMTEGTLTLKANALAKMGRARSRLSASTSSSNGSFSGNCASPSTSRTTAARCCSRSPGKATERRNATRGGSP
jgi:hypothetical protein